MRYAFLSSSPLESYSTPPLSQTGVSRLVFVCICRGKDPPSPMSCIHTVARAVTIGVVSVVSGVVECDLVFRRRPEMCLKLLGQLVLP